MAQVTTKNYLIHKAPKRIELLGDRTKRPEPATHIIEFPGGAIELSRTSDGNYWAHIIVNRDFALPGEIEGLEGAYGEIVGSRMDYEFPTEPNIVEVPDASKLRQIAILIKPRLEEIQGADSLPHPGETGRVDNREHIQTIDRSFASQSSLFPLHLDHEPNQDMETPQGIDLEMRRMTNL